MDSDREYLMYSTIGDQAFSPSYELTPSPDPTPLSRPHVVSLFQPSSVSPVEIAYGGIWVMEQSDA
jgi:hypothetical protein